MTSSSTLDDVENIFLISDLHADYKKNLSWFTRLCTGTGGADLTPGPKDVLIIGGDVSDKLSIIERVLNLATKNLDCHIFFIWGNHEAWVGKEDEKKGIRLSLKKVEAVKNLCNKLGVHTDFQLVGKSNASPTFIVPLDSWYDGSLAIEGFEGCEELNKDFDKWFWVDFAKCKWPDDRSLKKMCADKDPNVKFDPKPKTVSKNIPITATKFFALENEEPISKVQEMYRDWMEDETLKDKVPGLITVSHFLPNKQSLPDWMDPSSEDFNPKWLAHDSPELSAFFANVAGSTLIDEQVREMNRDIKSMLPEESAVQHLHLFGHSHTQKDFVYNGIRYISNPLGSPKERDSGNLHDKIYFQKIWDCRKNSVSKVDKKMSYAGGLGEIPCKRTIRVWEEKGIHPFRMH